MFELIRALGSFGRDRALANARTELAEGVARRREVEAVLQRLAALPPASVELPHAA